MKKELIMFIAYKTTENLIGSKREKSDHFGRAQALIAGILTLNIIEFLLMVNSIFFKKKIIITAGIYVSCIIFPMLLLVFVNLIFKKSVLARSIRLYKDTNFTEYGRGIGLLYVFLTLFIFVFFLY
jgi:hypothetical protein